MRDACAKTCQFCFDKVEREVVDNLPSDSPSSACVVNDPDFLLFSR